MYLNIKIHEKKNHNEIISFSLHIVSNDYSIILLILLLCYKFSPKIIREYERLSPAEIILYILAIMTGLMIGLLLILAFKTVSHLKERLLYIY